MQNVFEIHYAMHNGSIDPDFTGTEERIVADSFHDACMYAQGEMAANPEIKCIWKIEMKEAVKVV